MEETSFITSWKDFPALFLGCFRGFSSQFLYECTHTHPYFEHQVKLLLSTHLNRHPWDVHPSKYPQDILHPSLFWPWLSIIRITIHSKKCTQCNLQLENLKDFKSIGLDQGVCFDDSSLKRLWWLQILCFFPSPQSGR